MDFFKRRKLDKVTTKLEKENRVKKENTVKKQNKTKRNQKSKKINLKNETKNIDICEPIKSKNFKLDTSLKIQFMFHKDIVIESNFTIKSLKDSSKKKYVIYCGEYKRMYKMMLYICQFKINPGFIRYSLSYNVNPFDTTTATKKQYYYIIFKSGYFDILKYAILKNKINLYDFKNILSKFLRNYSKLNKKHGFIYNNINSESLGINKINSNMNLIMLDYSYSFDKSVKSIQRTLSKEYFLLKKYYNLDKINEKYEGNYEIISILLLINICNSYLNDIPKLIIITEEDNIFFNKKYELYDKINYLLKKDYFKTL